MATIKLNLNEEEVKALAEDDRGLRKRVASAYNEMLEAEIAEHLWAGKHKGTEERKS